MQKSKDSKDIKIKKMIISVMKKLYGQQVNEPESKKQAVFG